MRRKRFVAVLALAIPLLLVTACEDPPPSTAYEGPEDAAKVAIVGDSVTGFSAPQLRQAFADYRNSVVGNMGYTMRMMLDPFRNKKGNVVELDKHGNPTGFWVQRAAESSPDAIVIELGGNDLIDTYEEGQLDLDHPDASISASEREDIKEILGEIEEVPCAFWVVPAALEEVHWTFNGSWFTFEDMQMQIRLDLLAETVSALKESDFPELDLHLVRLTEVSDYRPALESGQYSDIPKDGIHPPPAGREIYAQHLRQEVDACLAGLPD